MYSGVLETDEGADSGDNAPSGWGGREADEELLDASAPFNVASAAQLTNRLAQTSISGDSRRERILEAARVALLRDGYEKITTRRIAEEADVNIATLHYYYGTKEALLSAAVQRALASSQQTLRAAIEAEANMAGALAGLFAMTLDLVKGRFGILRYDLATRGLRDPNARREANAIYDAFRELIMETVARHYGDITVLPGGVSVTDFAQYVVAAVDGIVLQHVLSGDDNAAKRSLGLLQEQALGLLERKTA